MRPRRSAAASNLPQDPAEWKALLGRKISVRYRLGDDAQHPFSEVVGVVSSVATGLEGTLVLEILSRRGRSTSVATDTITHFRVLA